MTATNRQKDREAEVRQLCAERGLTIERFGNKAWRIYGGGIVDILTVRLSHVSESELRWRKEELAAL